MKGFLHFFKNFFFHPFFFKIMPKWGSLEQDELQIKLSKVPEQQMDAYHQERVKKYRLYTRISYVFGVLAVVMYWVSMFYVWTFAVAGFILISITGFSRGRWVRTYHSLVSLRKRGISEEKKISEENKNNSGKKYRN